MKKTLYFEGAGWADCDTSKATDLQNCRIRTAFSVKEKVYYLEGSVSYPGKVPTPENVKFYIQHYMNITTAESLFCDYKNMPYLDSVFPATKAELLNFINTTTGADFTDIETVNDNSFRVFPDAPTGVDHGRVFRLGNTGEVYIAPQVLNAYEQFVSDSRADDNAELFQFSFFNSVDMTVDFCRKLLQRKGYKFTGTGRNEYGEPEAVFNDTLIWAGAIQEGNKVAIRLDKYSVAQ